MMQIADPKMRGMVEMELNNMSMFTVCANTKFKNLICGDPRIVSRYPFLASSVRQSEIERTKRSFFNKDRSQNGSRAFLFIFAYPGEGHGVNETVLSLVDAGLTIIDATRAPMEQEINEAYALHMARANQYPSNRDPGAIACVDQAYEALKPWTEKLVASPVRVYDRENPGGAAYDSLKAFFDDTVADILRTYPYSPDTMDLDESFYMTIGARFYVREGYYGKPLHTGQTDFIHPNYVIQRAAIAPERTPEHLFDFAWGRDDAWDDPKYAGEKVVILKKAFDDYIRGRLDRGERISFKEIFEAMRKPPYGLLPNVIGAILMGMFFRTWRRRGLIWTNGFQQDALDDSHLLTMIENGIHNQHTHYRNSLVDYIMLDDSRTARLRETLIALFDLDGEQCRYVPDLRSNLRFALEQLSYPVLSLRYADISGEDQAFFDALIAFVRVASDDGDRRADDAMAAYLDSAIADGGFSRRIRGYLRGDKLREGFAAMLDRHGVAFDSASAEKLARLCVGHSEWKWIWREESIVRGMRCDG